MWRYCLYGLIWTALSLVPLLSYGQDDRWDRALDRYEVISRHCSEWRGRLERGESVPKDSLASMLIELSTLKSQLQGTSGDMTPGQRRRFEAIRKSFSGEEFATESLLNETDRLYAEATTEDATALTLAQQTTRRMPVKGVIGASVGVYPDLSYGVWGGVTYSHWGAIIKARSNFLWQKTLYDCRSDGTTEGGYIWTDGKSSKVARHQITLDAIYTPISPLSIYLGAGYGVRTLCWRDSDGAWVRVADRSVAGLALDFGLLIRPIQRPGWEHLTLLVGGTWLPIRYIDAEIGLGWTF